MPISHHHVPLDAMNRQRVERDGVETGVTDSGTEDDPSDRAAVRVTIDIDGRRLVYDRSDLDALSIER